MRRKRRRPVDAVLDDQSIPAGTPGPGDVDVLRAAIDLRSADPGAGLPTDSFVDQLRDRLAADLDAGGGQPAGAGSAGGAGGSGRPGPAPARPATEPVSRRALLAGAGAVAAGVAGVVVDRTLLGGGGGPERAAGPARPSDVNPVDGAWVAVAPASALAGGAAHSFATPGVVGFVSAEGGQVRAVSGACTHRGCLLRLNADAGRLDCPCHRTAFALDGRTLFHQLPAEPPPLPRLRARQTGDQIEVFVPTERS